MDEQQSSAMDGSETDALHVECAVQLADLEAKWKRAVADYQNREKELAREREDFARFCAVDLIRDFLPIVDAMGAAAGGRTPEGGAGGRTSGVDGKTPDVEEPAAPQGYRAIQVLLHNFLRRHGVEPIGAVGDRVDYLLHEVVGTRVPTEQEREQGRELPVPGTILEVVQVGYTMHGKLLRPARVIIGE